MIKYSEVELKTAMNAIARGYTWIARDSDDKLCVYKKKPRKNSREWKSTDSANDADCRIIASRMVEIFRNIQFSDMKPMKIIDILEPPVLDSTERRYLTKVLKPLPRVKSIVKVSKPVGEYLVVNFCNEDEMSFPYFAAGTMYKGMTAGKAYTLRQLKLQDLLNPAE